MIDLDTLEERLELSLTEDLRVYRAGRGPAAEPDDAARPQSGPRPESRPESRPEPRPESRPEPRPRPWPETRPPEPRPEPARPQVFRPEPRPETRPAARPRPRPRREPRLASSRPVAPTPATAPRPSSVRTEAPSAGEPPPARTRRPRPAEDDGFAGLDLDLAGHARQVAECLAEGDRVGADRHISAHADLAAEQDRPADRRDAASLATMVALLDGREAEARSGSDAVLALGREACDPEAADRYWAQRLWVVLEWGGENEHGALLDYCRERAYRDDDTAWMGAISLLLARGGRVDEARAAFDAASRALDTAPGRGAWVDLATDLAEAAALLGDAGRAATITRALARTAVPSVTIGRGWVCKGATARYRGLLAAALGRGDEADREYRAATELQRRVEAGPLLARTLHEWGLVLQGRNDLRSRSYLQEGAELGRRLALVDFRPRSEERAS